MQVKVLFCDHGFVYLINHCDLLYSISSFFKEFFTYLTYHILGEKCLNFSLIEFLIFGIL